MDNQESTQTENKNADLQMFAKILQLFPDLHSLALYKIFERCDKNYVRTIDNILFIKRYCYFLNVVKKPESTNQPTCENDVVNQNQQINTNIGNNAQEPKNNYNYNAGNYNPQSAMQMQNHGNEQHNPSGDTYQNYVSSNMINMHYPQNTYSNLCNTYHSTHAYGPNYSWNYPYQFYNSSGNSTNSSVYNYSNSNMSNASVTEYQPNHVNFYNRMHPFEYQGEQHSSTSSDSCNMLNTTYYNQPAKF